MKFSVILLFATMLASADAQEKIKFSISVSSKDFGLPAGMGGVQADFSSGKGPDVERVLVRGAEKIGAGGAVGLRGERARFFWRPRAKFRRGRASEICAVTICANGASTLNHFIWACNFRRRDHKHI